MVSDVHARLEINSLKQQLGGDAALVVVGRRENDDVYLSETTVIGSFDTTNCFTPGDDVFSVVGSASPQPFVGHDSSSYEVLRVVSQDDEFLFFTEPIIVFFVDSSLTSASVDASSGVVSF